jgi:hypothetical protein
MIFIVLDVGLWSRHGFVSWKADVRSWKVGLDVFW